MTENTEYKVVEGPTRIELIDETGRVYTSWSVKSVRFSSQDEGKTLKIFVENNPGRK